MQEIQTGRSIAFPTWELLYSHFSNPMIALLNTFQHTSHAPPTHWALPPRLSLLLIFFLPFLML